MAIAMAKTARSTVTTVSEPCSTCVTSGASSESMMAPMAQNRLVITPQRQSRVSPQSSPISRPVERRMLASTRVSGAAGRVWGISRLVA